VAELGRRLRSVVQGYFTYHAVPGNIASLRGFSVGSDSALVAGSPPSWSEAHDLGPLWRAKASRS
jgi:hypothetical protein